jgi:hypothetical protein
MAPSPAEGGPSPGDGDRRAKDAGVIEETVVGEQSRSKRYDPLIPDPEQEAAPAPPAAVKGNTLRIALAVTVVCLVPACIVGAIYLSRKGPPPDPSAVALKALMDGAKGGPLEVVPGTVRAIEAAAASRDRTPKTGGKTVRLENPRLVGPGGYVVIGLVKEQDEPEPKTKTFAVYLKRRSGGEEFDVVDVEMAD